MTMPAPIRLYRHVLSGHCHRVELMLSLLGLPFEPVEMEFGPTGTRSPQFLRRNAFGQVPVSEDAGLTLPDSNPILVYPSRTYATAGPWPPSAPLRPDPPPRRPSLGARQPADRPGP